MHPLNKTLTQTNKDLLVIAKEQKQHDTYKKNNKNKEKHTDKQIGTCWELQIRSRRRKKATDTCIYIANHTYIR